MATVSPSPSQPAKQLPATNEQSLKNLHTLYYRAGNNPHAMTKNFFSPGSNIRETVDYAKKHCETMGLRFVRVQPFLSDFKTEERLHTGNGVGDAD